MHTIIPLGDHCAGAISLKDLGLRKFSLPFDWTTTVNKPSIFIVIYYIEIIQRIKNNEDINKIVYDFLGDMGTNNNVNSKTNVWFPHDYWTEYNVLVEKYIRRFERLKTILTHTHTHFLYAPDGDIYPLIL